jgi:hypothetical protein
LVGVSTCDSAFSCMFSRDICEMRGTLASPKGLAEDK